MKKSSHVVERRTGGRGTGADYLDGGIGNDTAAQSVRPWIFKCGAANDTKARMAA